MCIDSRQLMQLCPYVHGVGGNDKTYFDKSLRCDSRFLKPAMAVDVNVVLEPNTSLDASSSLECPDVRLECQTGQAYSRTTGTAVLL